MRRVLHIWLTALALLSLAGTPAQAQRHKHGNHRKKAPLSIPVRDMPVITPEQVQQQRVIPLRQLVKPNPAPSTAAESARPLAPTAQTPAGPNAPTIPGASIEGLGATSSFPTFKASGVPPDTDGAVGRTQYVQLVNSSFVVLDKATHAVLAGPTRTDQLWASLGSTNPCAPQGPPSTDLGGDGDGIVLYDHLADRWIITQFANASSTTGPFYECVAISQTADATGSFFLYYFTFSNFNGTQRLFNDYPKIGIWPDAYYFSYNSFTAAGAGVGSLLCALDRTNMLSGAATLRGHAGPAGTASDTPPNTPAGENQICFNDSDSGLLPSDLDGATLPPANSPNYFVEWFDTSNLAVWKFHVDFNTPTNSTLNGVNWASPFGPNPSTLNPIKIPVTAFTPTCGLSASACVPQSTSGPQTGSGQLLDPLSDRLMYRLAYRNFGSHESLVVNHSIQISGTGSGIRWYDIRNLQSTPPTIFQSGTWNGSPADSNWRWMGSAAMDKFGNLALGYSVSGTTMFPAVAYVGAASTDSTGTLGPFDNEATLHAGTGYEPTGAGNGRWGDYSAMSVDPQDDCTFWYTNEYYDTTSATVFDWHTRIGSFKLAQCQTTPSNTSVTPDTGSGSAQTFSFLYSDTGGAAQITVAQGLINASNSLTSACAFQYNKGANTFQIFQDNGSLNPATISPGSGSLSNSQCTINGGGTTVASAGNSLVVNLSVTFTTPTFDGTKNIYMSVADTSGTTTSFQPMGSWTVQ